jgi:Lon protease-like protein
MAVMAMFPLGSVLLPGGILPLHVFEPRYRDMVRDCLRADGPPEFGQALISHGWETGGGDDRVMVGTVAQMLQVDAIDEDRYALIAVGTRRITINAWLPDDPYPLADVDDWPDIDPDAPGLAVNVAAAHARVLAARALATEVARRLDDVAGLGDGDDVAGTG